jgi:dTDP-4-dehydrorhamnose 3,5-epimerase-like enzyme
MAQKPEAGGQPLDECRLITLPKITDPRGNLTFIEGERHVPFSVRRVFYLYDVPTGSDRGAHAHYALHQFLVCLSGSFDVALDDGHQRRTVHLNRPWMGLHIPPMIWASEVNFDPGSVCLVLASAFYDEADYIRDYDTFVRAVGSPTP